MRAPASVAMSMVRSLLPESTTTISSHHFSAARTWASNRSALRVMRTAETGGLCKRLSVRDERRAFDVDERQLLGDLVHSTEDALLLGANVVVPENHAARLHHP